MDSAGGFCLSSGRNSSRLYTVWVDYESEITYNSFRNNYCAFCAFSGYDFQRSKDRVAFVV